MKHAYRERPVQPICTPNKIEWAEPKQWNDGTGAIWFCWRQTSEAQMWEQVKCNKCRRRARWVGLASPFGDGEQYFSESDAWCYWCFPRHHLTEEQQRLTRHAEWARQETLDECLEIIHRAEGESEAVDSILQGCT